MKNGVATEESPIRMIKITNEPDLVTVWPHIKRQLEKLRHKDKSIRSWTSHSIFNAIRFGLPTSQPRTTAVELYVAMQEHQIQGFMVTQPLVDPFMNGIQIGIYVWILDANFELLEKFLPELDQLCRSVGGDLIEFHTGRTGWFRQWGRMAKLGFKVSQYRVERKVPWQL